MFANEGDTISSPMTHQITGGGPGMFFDNEGDDVAEVIAGEAGKVRILPRVGPQRSEVDRAEPVNATFGASLGADVDPHRERRSGRHHATKAIVGAA